MCKFIDLTGKRFGRLTVTNRADDYIQDNGRKRVVWNCICDCGKSITVFGDNLRNGHTRSCGCLARETTSKTSRKYNKYVLSNGSYTGYTSKGEKFYFDIIDYNKIKNYCWHIDANGYVATNIWENNKNRKMLMHRLIMDFPENMDIDHKCGKASRNDNRRSNIRVVTHSDNLKNVGIRINNRSGITGVSFENRTQKWKAYIKVNGENIRLGRFDNFEDAVAARKVAEEKYFGKFSYDNSRQEVS